MLSIYYTNNRYYSYYYKSGPLKDLWCRFGYDPAADKNSRIYQMVNVRLTNDNWLELKRKMSVFVGAGGKQSGMFTSSPR